MYKVPTAYSVPAVLDRSQLQPMATIYMYLSTYTAIELAQKENYIAGMQHRPAMRCATSSARRIPARGDDMVDNPDHHSTKPMPQTNPPAVQARSSRRVDAARRAYAIRSMTPSQALGNNAVSSGDPIFLHVAAQGCFAFWRAAVDLCYQLSVESRGETVL